MKKNFIEEWRILRNVKSGDFNIIIVTAAMFLFIIGLNVKLIFQMTSDQTEEIGRMQLESIRADFQDVISKAENATLQTADDVNRLIKAGASQQELVAFFNRRKHDQKLSTNGTCINVYGSDKRWTIIPDFDMPNDYHAPERNWYKGALEE